MNNTPLYYIRFLKPPPNEYYVGQHFTIVWTIESDLGNQAYWEPVPVTCSLQGCGQLGLRALNAYPKGNKKKVANKPYQQQSLPLSPDLSLLYDPLQGGGMVSKLVIEPLPGKPLPTGSTISIQLSMILSPSSRTTLTSHPVWQNSYIFQSSIWVLPTWSSPMQATVAKQRHFESESGDQAERILRVDKNRVIHIREDAVQSIARHVWDCGLGMCQFLSKNQMDFKYKVLLELGSGTGLVGIYAAELLKPKKVYLTDLADALEIMQQNVNLMQNESKVDMAVKELSWGPEKLENYADVDLVLLTDVLYNQSSHDLLLDTLDWILDNKGCRALLTYKERNPDEREFFTKVKNRGWKCTRVEGCDELVCEVYWIEK
ncbi:unnamed protein product [Mucor hiemalis]